MEEGLGFLRCGRVSGVCRRHDSGRVLWEHVGGFKGVNVWSLRGEVFVLRFG